MSNIHGQTDGRVVLRPGAGFNGVKVFSATKFEDRGRLGEKVTDWLEQNAERQVVEIVQTQSSDEAFHCIAITVFYLEGKGN
jgi:hypothetical protein